MVTRFTVKDILQAWGEISNNYSKVVAEVYENIRRYIQKQAGVGGRVKV